MTEPLDLAAIVEAGGEPRSAFIEIARIDFTRFGVGELVELSRAAGVEVAELGAALRSKDARAGGIKLRIAVALAWIIARRVEPDLTLEDVQRWRLEVRGGAAAAGADPTPTASRRAGLTGSSGSPGRPARTRAKRSG